MGPFAAWLDDPTSAQPAAGAKVQDGLAGVKVGDREGVATTKAGAQRRLRRFSGACVGGGTKATVGERVRITVVEPPLKLVLLENPGQGGTLNHLGVEVPDTETVEAEQARLAQGGLAATEERGTTCCYAAQDKFWVQGAPDGESWEIYTVLADSQTFYGEDSGRSQCCGSQARGPEEAAAAAAACC
jgi:hypothetical protein